MDSNMQLSDEGFGELMQMIGQEFAILQPSEADAS